jgi:arylsulfatase
MFGKHHNLPGELQSAAGPFDSWPTGLGFEYFYGFLGGDVSQWEPRLYRHTSLANDAEWTGRHLDWRLASDAIRWVHNQKAAAPEKPFFMYYAPGTLHAPHHAPPEMIARFRGRFDKGWDVQREETHRRQLAAGIIPRGTALTPRPTAIPAWSSLSAQEKAYQAKLMEVAAATLAYQDEQFGRILAELERMGELDRTLVVFIEGDNGASGEATTVGTTNELGALLNGVVDTPASMSREIDRMGGPETYQNYSLGWAWAMNAPFKWAKQFPNFLGGTRNGMIMRWPAGTQARPGIRSQFSHVIDVAPTLLAAARLPAPQRVDGIQQKPLDGINLLRSVEGAPEIPRTQYFEMAGARAIYKNGWLANTTARRMPWQFTLPPEVAAEPQGWELYDLSKDFSQSRDLAVHYPSKLTELQRAFEEEARRNNVYPIDELFAKARLAAVPNVRQGGRVEHVYWSADVSVAQGAALSLAGRSFEVVGDLLVSDRTSGVIAATGSRFGGWSFFLEGGRPVAVHAFSTKPEEVFRIASERVLPAGQQSIRFQFVSGTGLGAGGELSIYAGDELIAKGSIGRTILAAAGIGETFDIGRDTGAPVTQYQRPEGFFDGIIKKVTVSVAPRG